jgi:hypothetical protein
LQQTLVNNSTTNFKVKEFINRFKNVNTKKFELTFGEDNPASDGSQKFYYIWDRSGRLWSENMDYTLRVVTVLNSATEKTANWRFYCETKKDNFTSHYYWPKTDPRVQLSVRRGEGREGGRGVNKYTRDEDEWLGQLLLLEQSRHTQISEITGCPGEFGEVVE